MIPWPQAALVTTSAMPATAPSFSPPNHHKISMLKSTILVAVAALAFITTTAAQTSQVKNTGCPGAPYPTSTNVKINNTATFTFPTMSVIDTPIMILGYQSCNPTTLNWPLMCVNGCKLYTTTLYMVGLPRGTKSVKIPIPNDIRLWRSCFGVQTAAVTGPGCVNLHGSLSFCIGK